MAELRIGLSGWTYDSWRNGAFYPEDLPARRQLDYVAEHFPTVELNRSFYSLLRPETYERYQETTPGGFVFAVKGGRFLTHSKKLKDVEVPLANFLASGVLRLEEKLGPMLWQFPALAFDVERLRAFLDLLPRDTGQAARIARRHDDRVRGRTSMAVHESRAIRHAFEFRHERFLTEEVARMLEDHDAAMVFSDSGTWPYVEEITASWVYVRLHGSPHTYASEYGPVRLDAWAERVRTWHTGAEPEDAVRIRRRAARKERSGRDVYVYFDNDHFAHAPRDAAGLMERLGYRSPATSSEAFPAGRPGAPRRL